MAYEVQILEDAQKEYLSIIEYLIKVLQSPQAATSFMNEFDQQIERIASNPEIFAISKMPELAARGYHTAFINRYVMLYKTVGHIIYIAHIFHQTQDYARLL